MNPNGNGNGGGPPEGGGGPQNPESSVWSLEIDAEGNTELKDANGDGVEGALIVPFLIAPGAVLALEIPGVQVEGQAQVVSDDAGETITATMDVVMSTDAEGNASISVTDPSTGQPVPNVRIYSFAIVFPTGAAIPTSFAFTSLEASLEGDFLPETDAALNDPE